MKYLLVFAMLFGCSSPEVPRAEPKKPIESTFNLQDSKLEKMMGGEARVPQKAKKIITAKKNKSDKQRMNIVQSEKKIEMTLPDDYPSQYIEMDKKSKKLWSEVRPPILIGERSVYRITYFGLTVGDAIIENLGIDTLAGRKAHHYQLRLQSASFYRSIYSLDDYLDSYIDVETLTPLKYSLRQRETKQDVDDLQIFSSSEMKTYFWYRRLKKADGSEKKKETEAYIPRYFLDHFSGFIYMRGLSLKDHPLVEFPVVSRAEVSLMQLRFLKEEVIEIMDKKYTAWKVSVEAKLHDGLKKQGDLFFWYDAAEGHKLLKFEGKIKIGKVKGEMVDYGPGKIAE